MTSSTVLKPSSQGEREDILGIESSKCVSTEAWERMVPSGSPLTQRQRRALWHLRQLGAMCRVDHKKAFAPS